MKHETGKPDDHSEPLETAVPIIGIGASAGGLAAFESFFSQFPPEPGVAFVLVQHLSPDHQSNLVGILQRQTGLLRCHSVALGVYFVIPDRSIRGGLGAPCAPAS